MLVFKFLLYFLLDLSPVLMYKCWNNISFFFCGRFFFLSLADDLRLNSSVFQWPSKIVTEIEGSKIRLDFMRVQAEDHLQTRLLNKHFSHPSLHLYCSFSHIPSEPTAFPSC